MSMMWCREHTGARMECLTGAQKKWGLTGTSMEEQQGQLKPENSTEFEFYDKVSGQNRI